MSRRKENKTSQNTTSEHMISEREIEKSGNCRALQLEGRPTSRQSLWNLITKPIINQPTNLTIPKGTFRQSMSIY